MSDRRCMGEGNGAGCGPRDGGRIKHEGAKTRSDDEFLPQGTQRTAEDDDGFLPHGGCAARSQETGDDFLPQGTQRYAGGERRNPQISGFSQIK